MDTKTFNCIVRYIAKEVSKEALKNASENAKMCGYWSYKHHDYINEVDKQSILNESNIPNL